jgi:hypothetical protein
MRIAPRWIVLGMCLGFVACSADDDDSTDTTARSTAASGVPTSTGPTQPRPVITERAAVCDPLEEIAEFDHASAAALATGAPYEELRDLLVDSVDELTAAYEEVGTLVPALAGDVEVLRVVASAAADAAPDAQSMPELSSMLLTLPELAEAPAARSRVADLAFDRCGIA